jgi:hypothetical protein
MSTIKEIKKKTDDLIAEWEQDFEPLYRAVADIKGEMFVRIFGKGKEGGFNSENVELPTQPYSIKPIYVSKVIAGNKGTFVSKKTGRKVKNKSKNTKNVGTRDREIKSAYFPGGYAQLKQVLGKPPLELTGFLRSFFLKGEPIDQGFSCYIVIDDSQSGKVDGLESRYGIIFDMTDDEFDRFIDYHTTYVIEAINNKLND